MSNLPSELKCFDRTDPEHPQYNPDKTPTEPLPQITRNDAILDSIERLILRWQMTEMEFRAVCQQRIDDCEGGE